MIKPGKNFATQELHFSPWVNVQLPARRVLSLCPGPKLAAKVKSEWLWEQESFWHLKPRPLHFKIGLHSVRINSWFKRINSAVTMSLDGSEAAPKHCHTWVCSGVFDVRHGYFYPHRMRWWQSLEHSPQFTLFSEARPLSQTFITSSTWLLLLAGRFQRRLSLTSEARTHGEQPAVPFLTPANRGFNSKTKPVFQCTLRLGKRPYVF